MLFFDEWKTFKLNFKSSCERSERSAWSLTSTFFTRRKKERNKKGRRKNIEKILAQNVRYLNWSLESCVWNAIGLKFLLRKDKSEIAIKCWGFSLIFFVFYDFIFKFGKYWSSFWLYGIYLGQLLEISTHSWFNLFLGARYPSVA